MNIHPIARSFLSAAGVALYVSGVATVMSNIESFFDQANINEVFIGVAMLMLFVTSAAITGSLVLGFPVYAYLEGKKKEALTSFFWNLAFLAVFTLLAFVTILLVTKA